MSESVPDLRSLPRSQAYAELERHASAVLDGTTDEIAGMATIAAMVHNSLAFLWTGFYRVVEPGVMLRVGPYQGDLGCLEIEFGRGVCGKAAATGETVIVSDVRAFEGHITCDARARSEIVVPVFDGKRKLLGVLDVDSERTGNFGAEDKKGLENMVSWFTRI